MSFENTWNVINWQKFFTRESSNAIFFASLAKPRRKQLPCACTHTHNTHTHTECNVAVAFLITTHLMPSPSVKRIPWLRVTQVKYCLIYTCANVLKPGLSSTMWGNNRSHITSACKGTYRHSGKPDSPRTLALFSPRMSLLVKSYNFHLPKWLLVSVHAGEMELAASLL